MDEVDPGRMVDLRTQGLVTPVKNQRHAPICATLALLATVEGAYAKKTGKLLELSYQAIIDGDMPEDFLEDDGTPSSVYSVERFVVFFPFLTTIKNYPIHPEFKKGIFQRSKYLNPTSTPSIVSVISFNTLDFTENGYKEQIDKGQPVCAIIQCTKDFENYSGGIYRRPYDEVLAKEDYDHAVCIVGYGRTRGGTGFWICKNSWGPKWGIKGYVHISHGGGFYGYAGILRQCRVPQFGEHEDVTEACRTWSTDPPSVKVAPGESSST